MIETTNLYALALTEWAVKVEVQGRTQDFVRAGRLHLAAFLRDVGWPDEAGRQRFKENEALKEARANWEAKYCNSRDRSSVAVNSLRRLIVAYAAKGEILPTKNGALAHSDIAKAAGIELRKMERDDVRKILKSYADTHKLEFSRRGAIAPEEEFSLTSHDPTEMVPASLLREAQMRLVQADRRNAELKAENVGLRAQLMRGDEVAELISLGGRFRPDTP